MSADREFSRRYRAAASDFRASADRIAAARAEIEANRRKLQRDTRAFWRVFIGLVAVAAILLLALAAQGARH